LFSLRRMASDVSGEHLETDTRLKFPINMASMIIRTILITGATDGIGKQTALELAKNASHHVIVHGRDENRCKNTVSAIKSAIGNSNDNIDYIVADFAKMNDVKEMVAEVERRFPRLNVLICNAGVLSPKRQVTSDGLELNFQVNHLAHFLLTTKLTPLLKQNRPSRVVVVSSMLHSWGAMDWNDLMAEKNYEKTTQYSRSKLMNHLFAFALARRFANDSEIRKGEMTCNVLQPGVIGTKLCRAGGYSGGPVESGAVTPVYLAQASEVDGVNGQYFASKKITEPSTESRDESAQEKLWQISEDLCKKLGVW